MSLVTLPLFLNVIVLTTLAPIIIKLHGQVQSQANEINIKVIKVYQYTLLNRNNCLSRVTDRLEYLQTTTTN